MSGRKPGEGKSNQKQAPLELRITLVRVLTGFFWIFIIRFFWIFIRVAAFGWKKQWIVQG